VFPLKDDNPTTRTPWVTIVLIVANIAVFFLVQPQANTTNAEQIAQIEFSFEYAAIPCELVNGRPLSNGEIIAVNNGDQDGCTGSDTSACPVNTPDALQTECAQSYFPGKNVWLAILSSMFMHGSLMHIGGNMLYLWIFGNNIEDHLGPVKFLAFYLLAGAVATAAHVLVQLNSIVPVIGASGAVAGVMGAYLVWFPKARVLSLVFIMLTRVPAFALLGFWFVSQFFIGPDEGVAWMAHVGGFVFGALMALVVRRNPKARQSAWRDKYTEHERLPSADRQPQATLRDPWDNRNGGVRGFDGMPADVSQRPF
jgi:membrane associated rhomboid family serine protease